MLKKKTLKKNPEEGQLNLGMSMASDIVSGLIA
jgi:hypothetical protein